MEKLPSPIFLITASVVLSFFLMTGQVIPAVMLGLSLWGLLKALEEL